MKTHILCSITFFRKTHRLWDNVEKCNGDRGATNDVTIWRLRVGCWISKGVCTYAHAHVHALCISCILISLTVFSLLNCSQWECLALEGLHLFSNFFTVSINPSSFSNFSFKTTTSSCVSHKLFPRSCHSFPIFRFSKFPSPSDCRTWTNFRLQGDAYPVRVQRRSRKITPLINELKDRLWTVAVRDARQTLKNACANLQRKAKSGIAVWFRKQLFAIAHNSEH